MDQSILSEITKKAKAYWKKDLVSVVLFGSFVKGVKYNDIDVLIVLKDLPKGRTERIPKVVSFSRTLDLKTSVDILLYSHKECACNFRNHNPLFLDITLDGVVLYDRGGFAGGLIAETAGYLKDHNIVRKGTRWVFPFRRGVYAMSKVTNKDWIMAWLDDAQRDLLSARALYEENLFEKAVYHCQQCGEKAVKAVLLCMGSFEKTHKVSVLLREEAADKNLMSGDMPELVAISEFLEKEVSRSRYPELCNDHLWVPSKEYTEESAKEYIDSADKALWMANKFVEDWLK
jgi:HEPN domain-containing protein/predicted nucleotidyltransferase